MPFTLNRPYEIRMIEKFYIITIIIIFYHSIGGLTGLAKELLHDLAGSLPGIDEAKSFIQVMRYN